MLEKFDYSGSDVIVFDEIYFTDLRGISSASAKLPLQVRAPRRGERLPHPGLLDPPPKPKNAVGTGV